MSPHELHYNLQIENMHEAASGILRVRYCVAIKTLGLIAFKEGSDHLHRKMAENTLYSLLKNAEGDFDCKKLFPDEYWPEYGWSREAHAESEAKIAEQEAARAAQEKAL